MKITYEQIKNNPTARALVEKADEAMFNIGYTEHSLAHVVHVADVAQYILLQLGHSEREAELARIAAYLHDIGRAEYVAITDEEAVQAFEYLARTEGIIPAIESAHAVAYARKLAPTMGSDQLLVVTISGRGDKDCARYRGEDLHE